jgi:hypothetical protein
MRSCGSQDGTIVVHSHFDRQKWFLALHDLTWVSKIAERIDFIVGNPDWAIPVTMLDLKGNPSITEGHSRPCFASDAACQHRIDREKMTHGI